MKNAGHRQIPSVEKVLQHFSGSALPRRALTALIRTELARIRRRKSIPDQESITSHIAVAIGDLLSQKLQPVINGTGVIVHTNLGRAPLGAKVLGAVTELASNYANLEFDLRSGDRGTRAGYLEQNLALLCGAEAATLVNNCAAALVLILRHFTSQKPEVIISRGELIQIGGGFRIPDILEASGARLREVGTTNKTSVNDYRRAFGPETGLILRVHRSNFSMSGFVGSPSRDELAAFSRSKKIIFVEDLGSGAILPMQKLAGFDHEPTPAEAMRQGVDLVCFSGDKLFGGAQAGIIAGRRQFVGALKREPLFRALRCDKLVLTALQSTVDFYLSNETNELPVMAMLHTSAATLQERAEVIRRALRGSRIAVEIAQSKAQAGGGSLPGSDIPSFALDFSPVSPNRFARRLRNGSPPVIGTIKGRKFRVDLRSVFPAQDRALADAIRRVCQ